MQPDRTPLREQYASRWTEILSRLGVPAAALRNKHGPCPVCGGTDRFRYDDKDGMGTFICSQCGAGDGPKLAMLFSGKDFRELLEWLGDANGPAADRRAAEPVQQEELPEAKRRRMNALWGKAMPVRASDPAGIYLSSRLGRFPMVAGLRYQSKCPYPEGETWPAMLAIFLDVDGTPSGLHRTYLTPEGRKAPVVSSKLSLGPLRDGGAVRLATEYGDTLGIAEGIETALAASILFDVPCWAALNANRLAKWVPPAGVRKVVVFADNDESFIGQTAAFDLAALLEADGKLAVTIETPFETGTDWADVLMSRRRAA
ncbi:MAG: toprim domain-containing protein [Devosia sp.]